MKIQQKQIHDERVLSDKLTTLCRRKFGRKHIHTHTNENENDARLATRHIDAETEQHIKNTNHDARLANLETAIHKLVREITRRAQDDAAARSKLGNDDDDDHDGSNSISHNDDSDGGIDARHDDDDATTRHHQHQAYDATTTVNLNIVDENQLAQAKRQMDVTFEQNRIHYGDENFVYDVIVDFGTQHCAADGNTTSNNKGEWDSSDEDDEDGDEGENHRA